jgi:hypothetical protein
MASEERVFQSKVIAVAIEQAHCRADQSELVR